MNCALEVLTRTQLLEGLWELREWKRIAEGRWEGLRERAASLQDCIDYGASSEILLLLIASYFILRLFLPIVQ